MSNSCRLGRPGLNFMKPSLSISVVIPVHNRADICIEALRSVYAQTVPSLEVIVVNDGSSDDMQPVRELLSSRGGQYLVQEQRGVSAARNAGVACATGEWIAFLDSDDLWLPAKLEEQLALHQRDPELVFSQTGERWIRNGRPVPQRAFQAPACGESFARSLELCCISASAVMIRKDVLLEVGGFDESFPVCEDYDLWLRLTRRYPIGLVEYPLVVKHRGRADHLSESVRAPDLYRLKAIQKILGEPLSVEQERLARLALEYRISILETGARKRGLEHELREYAKIRETFCLVPPSLVGQH